MEPAPRQSPEHDHIIFTYPSVSRTSVQYQRLPAEHAATTLQSFIRSALAQRELENSRRHSIDPQLIKCIHPYLQGEPLNALRCPVDGRTASHIHFLDQHNLLIRRFYTANEDDSSSEDSSSIEEDRIENNQALDAALLDKFANNRKLRDLFDEKGFGLLKIAKQTLIRWKDRTGGDYTDYCRLVSQNNSSSDSESEEQDFFKNSSVTDFNSRLSSPGSSSSESDSSIDSLDLIYINSENIILEELLPSMPSPEASAAFYVKHKHELTDAILEWVDLLKLGEHGDYLGHKHYINNPLYEYGAPRRDNLIPGVDHGKYVLSLPDCEFYKDIKAPKSFFNVAVMAITHFPYHYDAIIKRCHPLTTQEMADSKECHLTTLDALNETTIKHLDFLKLHEGAKTHPLLDLLDSPNLPCVLNEIKELVCDKLRELHQSEPANPLYIGTQNLELATNQKLQKPKEQEAIVCLYMLGTSNLLDADAEKHLQYYCDHFFSKHLDLYCSFLKEGLKEIKKTHDNLTSIKSIAKRTLRLVKVPMHATLVFNAETPKTSYEFSVKEFKKEKSNKKLVQKLSSKPVHHDIVDLIIKRSLDSGPHGFKICFAMLEVLRDKGYIANVIQVGEELSVYF